MSRLRLRRALRAIDNWNDGASRSYALVLLIALAGCGSDSGQATADASTSEVPGSVQLTGEVIAAGPLLGYPGALAFNGGQLWIADFSGDPFVHILDLTTKAIVSSRGRRGPGPGEFQSIDAIFPTTQRIGEMWAYDGTGRKLVRLAKDGAPRPELSVKLPAVGGITHLAPSRNGWLGWTRNADSTKRFVLLDQQGVVSGFAAGNLLGKDPVPFKQRIIASVNLLLCMSPNRERFAITYAAAQRVEIHDSTGTFIAFANVPAPTDAVFVADRAGAFWWQRPQYNYVACVATNNHIYALYSGRTDEDPETGKSTPGAEYAHFIHVFNWSGDLLTVYSTTEALGTIAVTDDEQWLYAGVLDSPAIIRYALPNTIGSVVK